MPVVSQQQNKAMHAAAEGRSTLGIPQAIGKDFVTASHGMHVSALPTRVHPQSARPASSVEALTGLPSGKKPTHRGRRSRGKGSKPHPPKAQQHLSALNHAMDAGDHAKAKTSALHLANALHAATRQAKKAVMPPDVPDLAAPSLAQPLGGV